MNFKKQTLLLLSAMLLMVINSFSQNVPQGVNYQGIALDVTGNAIVSTTISIRIGIRSGSATGTLEWEETHSVPTNQFGLFALVIGQGTTTGAGSMASFSSVTWGNSSKFMKVEMDPTGGSSYTTMDNSQLLSVPYSLYSLKTGSAQNPVSMNDLIDADTTGTQIGKTLKWNGTNWVPANDNNSDTALYAWNGSSITDWHVAGNTTTATDFIGTTNNSDLIMKTNNTEQMRITSAGKIGIGTAAPIASVHIMGNDGFISQGTFGSGTVLNPGNGTYMYWYPRRAAFRGGYMGTGVWANTYIGDYSFAYGYGSNARGFASVAMGQTSGTNMSDSGSVAMGWVCATNGKFACAMGNHATANGDYSVAMGRGPLAGGIGSAAIGYHVNALGNYSTCMGYYSTADGDFSTALGTETSSGGHTGCFIWADNTNYGNAGLPNSVNNTNNQFWVKASGGTVFYTDPYDTTGVMLAPGGGSWINVSDRNKKEHFRSVDGEMMLKKISQLEISEWNYKTQPASIRHIGPMAQDLFEAFHYGESDTTITSSDIDGINMMGVQALVKRTTELKAKAEEIEQLKKQVAQLTDEKAKLEKRINSIEKKLKIEDTPAQFTPGKK